MILQVYRSKLRELKRASRAVFKRVTETQLRPKLLNNLNTSLNVSRDFLSRMKNLSSELQIFTDVEMTTLETLIEETEVSWYISLSFPSLILQGGEIPLIPYFSTILYMYVNLRNSREEKVPSSCASSLPSK